MRMVTAAAVAALLAASPALCAPAPATPTADPAEAAREAKVEATIKSIKPQHGTITIPGTDAKLNLSDRYIFLDAADAKKFLTDVWGNRPEEQEDVLGMIMPAQVADGESLWGAVVTWQGDGYVSDTDAKKIDYADTLKKMQDGDREQNEERVKAGFPEINVVGWAVPPSYDPATHTMIWARELQIGGKTAHGLNYDVRLLGRKGVLSLNIIGGMADLAAVQKVSGDVRQTAQFDPGARYADFQKGDHMAAYGLAGLLAAGVGLAVAKKAGLIAVILLLAKKFGVIIIAALSGAGAWISRQWGRLTGRRRDASNVPPPPPEDGV